MMTVDEYSAAFQKEQELRFERLSKEYVVQTPDGPVNAGYFRNNAKDIREELADALNILEIRIGRAATSGQFSLQELAAFQHFTEGITIALGGLYELETVQDPSYRTEEVTRIVTDEECGYAF